MHDKVIKQPHITIFVYNGNEAWICIRKQTTGGDAIWKHFEALFVRLILSARLLLVKLAQLDAKQRADCLV